MIDEPKPGAHICNVSRCREVTDCVKVLLAWAHIGRGDFESRKLNSVCPKHEFVWVENDAIVSTEVEPLDCLKEALIEVVCPE